MLYIISCLVLAQKGGWDCTQETLTWPLDGWGSVGLDKPLHPAINLQGGTLRLTKLSPLFVFGPIIKCEVLYMPNMTVSDDGLFLHEDNFNLSV